MKFKRSLKTMAFAALTSAVMTGTAFAGTLSVYSTSDVHGSIVGWNYFTAKKADLGLAKVSTLINNDKKTLTKNDASLIIDAGDIIQGTPLDTYMVKNEKEWTNHPMMAAYNQIGYDYFVCGNHEFNFGMDYLRKVIGKNTFLTANLIDEKTGKTWDGVKRYVIKELKIDGKKIRVGIIGTVTPSIPMFETPAHYAGMRFESQIPVMQQCIKELKKEGVDLIIGVTHSGVERADRDSFENQVVGIAKACPELSLLICAHNHVVIDNKSGIKGPDGTVYKDSVIDGVPVVESGKDGKFVGISKLNLTKKKGKWQVNAVTTEARSVKGLADDPAIVQGVKPWHEKTRSYLQTKIGTATDAFIGPESNHRDSAILDLVNKIQREASGTQLSASAAFNPTQSIEKGDITLQEISGLYIYENYIYGIEINGAELRKYMEHAAAYYGTSPDYNYDMIDGVDYTIDLNQPKGSRITKLQYKGKDVKDSDIFTMTITDYRMNGGSGYMAAMGYTDGKKPKVVYDSQKALSDDGQVRTLIVDYIKKHKTITPTVDNNWNVIPKK